MTRYKISEQTHGINIDLTEVNDQQQDLLAVFDQCRQGNCSCPTDQYQHVEAMDLAAAGEAAIAIHLQAKPGSAFDPTEIAACLEHIIEQVDGPQTTP